MYIPTCWNCFNEVFYPEVRRITCQPILLVIDNAPGLVKVFQRENLVVRYVIPNVTSWKQPCDLGVFAAIRKRYKFLLLKHVLSFDMLDNDKKQL